MTELKSNTEWKQWGKDDPLWGVASWAGKEKDGASPWTDDEFYANGESDWQDVLRQWQHYGVRKQACLEIGCGAGRITKSLAAYFERVYAVDVSPEMISYAQNAIKRENIEFALVDGLHLPQTDCSVSAVFTTIVLQHLDSKEIGFDYFRELYRVLDAGGTIMVGLPLYKLPFETGVFGALMSFGFALRRALSDIGADLKRRLGVKTMRYTQYPISSLHQFLASLGFKNIEFRFFPATSNGALVTYVFATK
jgi:ubiquinone/menaquinone biosynthesis C-methylase UbiE